LYYDLKFNLNRRYYLLRLWWDWKNRLFILSLLIGNTCNNHTYWWINLSRCSWILSNLLILIVNNRSWLNLWLLILKLLLILKTSTSYSILLARFILRRYSIYICLIIKRYFYKIQTLYDIWLLVCACDWLIDTQYLVIISSCHSSNTLSHSLYISTYKYSILIFTFLFIYSHNNIFSHIININCFFIYYHQSNNLYLLKH
jgi:hypothetical protein